MCLRFHDIWVSKDQNAVTPPNMTKKIVLVSWFCVCKWSSFVLRTWTSSSSWMTVGQWHHKPGEQHDNRMTESMLSVSLDLQYPRSFPVVLEYSGQWYIVASGQIVAELSSANPCHNRKKTVMQCCNALRVNKCLILTYLWMDNVLPTFESPTTITLNSWSTVSICLSRNDLSANQKWKREK